MRKNIYLLKHSSKHHASHSGYGRLSEYIEGNTLPCSKSVLPYRWRKVLTKRVSQDFGIYNSDSIQKELELSYIMLKRTNCIAHFFNAERDVRFTTLLKTLRDWTFVATFHKPPCILEKQIKSYKYLKRLDKAIAVGINQVDYLKSILNAEIKYIPHGVDIDFFSPSESSSWEQNKLLFVGQHLRDFRTLEIVFKKLKELNSDFELNAVVRKDAIKYLPNDNNVKIFTGLSDFKLRELYRRSTLLLLPLLASTACNSILEAMSCGLPVVTSNIGGVKDYVDDSCGMVSELGDIDQMVNDTMELNSSIELNNIKRLKSREKSREFAWPIIARRVFEFYYV